MKNMFFKFLTLCVSLAVIISSCVYATEYRVFFGDGMVDYEKRLSEEDVGKSITISVIDVDKAWNETAWENTSTDVFVYADNKTVDENGDIVIDFIVENSGVYSVILGVDNATENIYDKVEVIIKSQAETAIERLKTASSEELEAVLKEYKNELGLTSDNFDNALEELVNVICNSKENLDSNTENNIFLLKKALKVAEFNCGIINSVAGSEEIIGLKGSEYEKWYKESFDAEIVRRLTRKSFKTVVEFEKALKEAVLLERIENPSGNGDIVSIISENHSEMNLSYSSVSLSVAGKLAEGSYSNYKALNDKIAELKNVSSGSGGGSSSGGGGGSFGGGSSGVGVIEVETKTDKEEVSASKQSSRFNDMKGYEWAESSVETLATEGIVNGKGNGMFDPGANVTREEFAKMIVSLFNFNVVSPNFKFTDVNKDSWYYEYVRRAHGCRVINGISDTLFGSGQNILRQDAVVMVYNALKYINRAENGDVIKNFNDESEVSDYARTAVDVLSSCGIIKGDNIGNLYPKADITRAEAAVIIYNVMTKYDL